MTSLQDSERPTRRRWWHCRGPFFHQWGYNAAPFFPLRGCLRDGCDYVTFDYNEGRIRKRLDEWDKPVEEARQSASNGGEQ